MTEFQVEITPEIFGLHVENQFRDCNDERCSYLTGHNIFNNTLTCQDGCQLNK